MTADSTYPASGVINDLRSLRAALSASELLTLVGRIAAWAQSVRPPDQGRGDLNVPALDALMPERTLRQIVDGISEVHTEVLPIAELIQAPRIHHERIDDVTLRRVVWNIFHAVLVSSTELADSVVSWWTSAERFRGISPPFEVASTMLQLVGTTAGESVYCLGSAAEPAAIECMRHGRRPVIVSADSPLLAIVYSLITGIDISVVLHDPLSLAASNYFREHGRKPTLAVPALGAKITHVTGQAWPRTSVDLRTAEALTIDRVDKLSANRAVILIPNGILFRAGAEQRLRQDLIERGHVQTIVSFPPGLLSFTNLPFSLMVLDTERSADAVTICEIDAKLHIKTSPGMLKQRVRRFTGEGDLLAALKDESSTCRRITRAEIKALEYNLSANRHRTVAFATGEGTDSEKLVPFEEIATIVKPQAFRSLDTDDAVTIGEIGPGELPAFGFVEGADRYRRIDPLDRERLAQQRLRENDVLLSTKGIIGHTAIAGPDVHADEIFPSQSIVILRLNPDGPIRDPIALMMFLRSPYFQWLLQSLIVGTTIQNVALTALRRSPVRVPSLAVQLQLRRTFESQRELQHQIDALMDQQRDLQQGAWNNAGLGPPEPQP